MAEASKINSVLGHLAWLRAQLETEINRRNAYAGALLVYNAAAMLQWHFVFLSSDRDRIQSPANRTLAAKVIDDFVWEVRALFQEAKRLRDSGREESKAATSLLDKLTRQITKVLRRLPNLAGLPAVHPVRCIQFEQELEPASLLNAAKGSRRAGGGSKATTRPTGAVSDARKSLRTALAGTLFVQQSQQAGHLVKGFVNGGTEVVAAILEQSLENYVATLSGKSAERTDAIGRDTQTHLAARLST